MLHFRPQDIRLHGCSKTRRYEGEPLRRIQEVKVNRITKRVFNGKKTGIKETWRQFLPRLKLLGSLASFLFATLASKRSRDLVQGKRPITEDAEVNPVSQAAKEMSEGLISYKEGE